jgi:hypothetical protein
LPVQQHGDAVSDLVEKEDSMFEFLDLSSYGKADVVPASVALALGLLWATFIPYSDSEQYGLHPLVSVLRALAVCVAMIFALQANDAGFSRLASVAGLFSLGFGMSPCFVASRPIGRSEERNYLKRKLIDFGNTFLDGKFASLVALPFTLVLSFVFGFDVAMWCTMALAIFLLMAKIGKAQEGSLSTSAGAKLRFIFFALAGTASMCVFLIAFTGINGNLVKLHFSDLLAIVTVAIGLIAGAIF